jgi:hypothetical protein
VTYEGNEMSELLGVLEDIDIRDNGVNSFCKQQNGSSAYAGSMD